jgi:preprotein translocase subunit YajC
MPPNTSVPLIFQLLPFAFMFGVFYFLIIKPQKQKQKEHQLMVDGLKKNDEIVTSGGIHGTIVNVKDKTFVIRVDETAKIEIDKAAVAYVEKQRSENSQGK